MFKKIFFLDILVLRFLSPNYLKNTFLRGNAIEAKIQLLDIYGFRLWKNFIKHFPDIIISLDLAVIFTLEITNKWRQVIILLFRKFYNNEP